MKRKSICHPDRPELYSYENAYPWERGLCSSCVAREKRTRNAERERVRIKLERSEAQRAARGGRVPRFVSTAGVSFADWQKLVQIVGGRCTYCRRPSAGLAIHYLVPLARGGKDHPDNAIPTCPRCVHCKGKRLITEWPAARTLLSPALFDLLERRTLAFAGEVKP